MNFRDLLDWISGRKNSEPVQEEKVGRERRRFYRVDLSDGEIFLQEKGPFVVVNLSYGGLRVHINDSAFLASLQLGTMLNAQIRLERIKLSCNMTVCNLWQNDIGCSFVDLPPAHSRMLTDFLKPRVLGSSLKEINAGTLRNPDEHLRLRWFQGDDGVQIFLWQTLEGDVVKEEFYFMDYIIAMDKQKKSFQVGAVQGGGTGKAGFGRIDSGAIAFFQVPSFRALKIGRVILEAASLPQEARDHLLATIATEERRLYNRYIIGDKDTRISFIPDIQSSSPERLSVLNLSLKGIAFMVPENRSAFSLTPGSELHGNLTLPGGLTPVLIKIVYIHDHVTGGNMEFPSPEGADLVAAFLGPRLLGQSLEEVPPPSESRAFAPPGSRGYLFIGVHNTHLLSLVAPKNRLVFGRISFMDFTLVFERNQLAAYSCPRGIIFPSDWELPLDSVEAITGDVSEWKSICRQMLETANLPAEVVSAWKAVLN